MTGPSLGIVAIVLAAFAVTLAAYFLYPFMEGFFQNTTASYLSWVTSTQEKMFQPVVRARVALAMLVSTLSFTVIGFMMSRGFGWITFLFTAFLAWIGWKLPRWWVLVQWQRRIARFDTQLVDALNLMANSLKSGLNLGQVIQVLVQEMPNPISQEFGLVLSQQRVGLSLDDALEKMVERIPSDDLNVAIQSILILREKGGDLSETFDTIAKTIRERRKVDGKIKAMTQQGKTQGLLLFMMPFGLGILLYVMNPEFVTPLFTTRLGWMMIVVMLIFQIIGGIWIKKIVTIDI